MSKIRAWSRRIIISYHIYPSKEWDCYIAFEQIIELNNTQCCSIYNLLYSFIIWYKPCLSRTKSLANFVLFEYITESFENLLNILMLRNVLRTCFDFERPLFCTYYVYIDRFFNIVHFLLGKIWKECRATAV